MTKKHRAKITNKAGETFTREMRQERGATTEKRFIDADFEIRASETDELGVDIVGMTFGEQYSTPFFSEVFLAGAFDTSIEDARAGRETIFIFNGHDSSQVLASTSTTAGADGSVTLTSDSRVLLATARFSNTSLGRDIHRQICQNTINGASIGFQTLEERAITEEDGTITYEQISVRLFEISVVPHPAYRQTSLTPTSPSTAQNPDDEEDPDDDEEKPTRQERNKKMNQRNEDEGNQETEPEATDEVAPEVEEATESIVDEVATEATEAADIEGIVTEVLDELKAEVTETLTAQAKEEAKSIILSKLGGSEGDETPADTDEIDLLIETLG